MPPPPPRFLHIHNVLGSAAVCEKSHPLQGSFLYQCLCSHCLNTDLITIKWRLLWNGAQKYELAKQEWHNEQIRRAYVCWVWSLATNTRSKLRLIFCVCVLEVRPWLALLGSQWLTALLSVPEASQLPAVGLAAEPVRRAGLLFVLDCSVTPSMQPGPCQRPCHLCLRPVPTADPDSTASQRRARPGRDRCRQLATPPPRARRADACCDGATYLKLSNWERRVISPTHSQSPHRKRPWVHHRERALMSDMEHPPESQSKALQTGLRPDWLTRWLTALLCPLRNRDEKLSWRGLRNTDHTHPCLERITCSFVRIVVSLYRVHVF